MHDAITATISLSLFINYTYSTYAYLRASSDQSLYGSPLHTHPSIHRDPSYIDTCISIYTTGLTCRAGGRGCVRSVCGGGRSRRWRPESTAAPERPAIRPAIEERQSSFQARGNSTQWVDESKRVYHVYDDVISACIVQIFVTRPNYLL